MPLQCRWGWVLGVLVLAVGGRAHAVPIYEYVFDQNQYTVAPGGTVQVQVLLREDTTGGDPSLFAGPGLIGAGVLLTFNDTTVQVANLGDLVTNPQFDDDLTSLTSTNLTPGVSADLTEGVGLGAPVTAGGSGPVYEILVGTFTFTANLAASPGHVTSLTATRRDANSQDNVGADGPPPTVLDSVLQAGSATITVNSVATPEPASLILMALGGLGLFGYSRLGRARPL